MMVLALLAMNLATLFEVILGGLGFFGSRRGSTGIGVTVDATLGYLRGMAFVMGTGTLVVMAVRGLLVTMLMMPVRHSNISQ
jgi:hypothetical protein